MAKATYTSDTGLVHPIRISAADLAAQPTKHADGAVTSSISAKISRSNKAYGLRPRYFVLTRTLTSADGTLSVTKIKHLAILLPADFTTPPATVTIGGVQWTYSGKVGENEK